MSILDFCKMLNDSDIATQIRESTLLFPFIEGLHLLGLSISVGLIVISDLRLAGLILRKRPASEVWCQLFPWMMSGFVVMIVTGLLLFWSHALSAEHASRGGRRSCSGPALSRWAALWPIRSEGA